MCAIVNRNMGVYCGFCNEKLDNETGDPEYHICYDDEGAHSVEGICVRCWPDNRYCYYCGEDFKGSPCETINPW